MDNTARMEQEMIDDMETMEIEFDDGTKRECMILCIFGIDYDDTEVHQEYIALSEITEDEENLEGEEVEVEVFFQRYYPDPLDDQKFGMLGNIDDEEEFLIVQKAFEEIMEE